MSHKHENITLNILVVDSNIAKCSCRLTQSNQLTEAVTAIRRGLTSLGMIKMDPREDGFMRK